LRFCRPVAFLGCASDFWAIGLARNELRGSIHGMAAAPESDHAALDALSRQYRAVLLRYFARRGVDPSDLEDLTQEVFTRLSARDHFINIERRDAYLFETAAHVAVDHHRRAAVRHRQFHDTYDDVLHGTRDFSPERVQAGREELDLVTVALRELPERTRHVFLLARLESLPYVQISQQLKISISAVEKHLVKAIAHLSMRLGRQS
jgi:RNA polymerase sigma factor (sigma-70 family)